MTDTLAAATSATASAHPVRALAPLNAHTALAVDTTGAVGDQPAAASSSTKQFINCQELCEPGSR